LFHDAPPQDLRLSQTEDVTAVEILTFLTSAVRSHDVVFRLASNGMTNQTAAGIINYHRIPSSKGDVDSNMLCYISQTAMRAFDYEFAEKKMVNGIEEVVMREWTNHLHRKYNLKDKNRPWTPRILRFLERCPRPSTSTTTLS
jgi:hypothetical protein